MIDIGIVTNYFHCRGCANVKVVHLLHALLSWMGCRERWPNSGMISCAVQ